MIEGLKEGFPPSSVKHQLKSPLTRINLYSESLLSGSQGKLTAEQKDYLNEIHQASQDMVKIINQVFKSNK